MPTDSWIERTARNGSGLSAAVPAANTSGRISGARVSTTSR
ncbi:hypothetical protein [Streptomyces chartreusis]